MMPEPDISAIARAKCSVCGRLFGINPLTNPFQPLPVGMTEQPPICIPCQVGPSKVTPFGVVQL